MTIGNNSISLGQSFFSNIVGQSFINDPSGTGVSILLNDWTFDVNEYDTNGDPNPLFSSATLNIYAGVGSGGTLIRSVNAYDSTVTLNGRIAAKWTFAGGLSLIDNQAYTAAVVVTAPDGLEFGISNTNPYANGLFTRNSLTNASNDTLFQANFSSATPVPFEFEPTGGLLVLGGGWLLRRHLKKKATKVK